MRDTSAIPRLFSSFQFNFPESWVILSDHMEFFSLYPVTFVFMVFPSWIIHNQMELFVKLLTKFMESDIGCNLKEITASTFIQSKEMFGLPSPSLFLPSSGNMGRKLQKLDYRQYFQNHSPILDIFQPAFASGKYNNLTSMGLPYLLNGSLDFPGLDLTKLTRLEIEQVARSKHGTSPILKFTSGLLNCTRNGMMLKNFAMFSYLERKPIPSETEFSFEHLRLICSNLTQFLSSQSSTLESLEFGFSIVCTLKDPVDVPDGAENWCKIHLPIFEVLQTLELTRMEFELIEANPRRKLFGITKNLSFHFPKLVNLTLRYESSLDALKINPAMDEAGQLQLKRLIIRETWQTWRTSFVGVINSVKELVCSAEFLCGEILPWAESLCRLYIRNESYRNAELKFAELNYFKKLEILITNYDYESNGEIKVGSLGYDSMKVDDYLATFKEATELSLTFIAFIGRRMAEETKAKFIIYFPFPVVFKTTK